MKRFIAAVVILLLFVGLLSSMGVKNVATQAVTPAVATVNPAPLSTPTAPSLSPASPSNKHFTLADIAQAYNKNEADADKRFRFRRFGVSAQVETVESDNLGLLVENVARAEAKLDAKGVLDARSIKAGQSVVLSCIGDGTGFYAVQLVKCHVVTGTSLIPKDPPPVFSQSPGLPIYLTDLQCVGSNQSGNWVGSAADWQVACFEGETQDKHWLVSHWRDFEPKTRENCIENGEKELSYSYLRTCLQAGGI